MATTAVVAMGDTAKSYTTIKAGTITSGSACVMALSQSQVKITGSTGITKNETGALFLDGKMVKSL